MASGEPIKTSFGFKNTVEKRDFRVTGNAKFAGEVRRAQEEDEGVEVAVPKKKLVIPVPEGGEWNERIKKLEEDKKKKDISEADVPMIWSMDEESAAAAIELIKNAAGNVLDIGRAAVPRLEDLPKLDISEKNGVKYGDEASLDDYEDVPVQDFGVAMLRGMGMTDQEFIEMRKKDIHEVVPRPVGLGLGAAAKFARKNRAKQGEDEDALKPGHFVRIESGSHRGNYGKIEGMDSEGRVIIRLALGAQTVSKSEGAVVKVTEDEYKKDSKIINKGSYEDFKKRQSWLAEADKGDVDKASSSRPSSSSRETNGKREGKVRVKEERSEPGRESRETNGKREERVRVKEERNGSGRDSRETNRKREDRVRVKEERSDSRDSKSGRPKEKREERKARSPPPPRGKPTTWVRANLRVRMVSQTYKQGKYYNVKLVVEDVPSVDQCVCITDDGVILDVNPEDLETVVPRDADAYIMVVKGSHRGSKGRIIDLDRRKYLATVKLDRARIVEVKYDDICEYVTR